MNLPPASVRFGYRELKITEGITEPLFRELENWALEIEAEENRWGHSGFLDATRIANRLQIEDFKGLQLEQLFAHCKNDFPLLLDVVEYIAQKKRYGEPLKEIFDDCNHKYVFDLDMYGFTPRVMTAQFETLKYVAARAEIAAEHLFKAWISLFTHRADRQDPAACWHSCVKALEAMYAPLIIPNDKSPRVGKICAALRDGAKSFSSPLPGAVDFVLTGLTLVGYEPGRHQDGVTSEKPTAEQAEIVLFTTINLCSLARAQALSKSS